MSDEKNRDLGPPKAFDLFAIQSKFPQARPIFWAGGQDTNNPDGYVEPSNGPTNLSPMQIPQTIRFIIGGREPDNSSPAPIDFMLETTIYNDSNDSILTGSFYRNQSVQIESVNTNILVPPVFTGIHFFWRIIEYMEVINDILVLDDLTRPPTIKPFYRIIKTGEYDVNGNVVGESVDHRPEGDAIVPVTIDVPKSDDVPGSGVYSIEVFFTVQYSSDGTTWTTDPLSTKYGPVP